MRKRTTYIEMPDDGLVNFRGDLVTPERAREMCAHLMAGFDELPPAERYAWNYATRKQLGFSPSSSPLAHQTRSAKKAIKTAGAVALLDDLGL